MHENILSLPEVLKCNSHVTGTWSALTRHCSITVELVLVIDYSVLRTVLLHS